MLVLSVNLGDYVMIGDDIMVKIDRVKDDLKLAIDAPRDVRIQRGRVYERTHQRPEQVEVTRKT